MNLTQKVMNENIDKLLETKEKLEITLEKTSKMQNFSIEMSELASKMKKGAQGQNIRYMVMIALLLVVLVLVIVMAAKGRKS